MALASLPQDPDLDQLRNQARDLQRAVRAGDETALARIAPWFPPADSSADLPTQVPPAAETFRLTAAQLVVAREHGFPSWARLRRYVEIVTARSWIPGDAVEGEPVVDRFLRLACLTYSDEEGADRAAARELLGAHPDLPTENLFVAAACADAARVRQHLAARPAGASETGGPHGWSPLLYLAYARHDRDVSAGATLETARLLLDAGADPNDGRFWHGLPTPFTVLTGVLGGGERDEWPHPHATAFARLLLDAGADPNDGQAIYNRMFSTNDDHLVLLFEYGLGRETPRGPWYRLLGDSLETPAVMLRSLLGWAVAHDQRDRVALLARHGVDIVSPFTEARGPARLTPIEFALMNGHRELAELLASLGAAPPDLGPGDSFVAAVLAGDAEAAEQAPARVVATVRRRRTGLVTWAAAVGAPSSVELLARFGFDVNALGRSDMPSNMAWHTALHVAASHGDVSLARRLLELGADPTIRDANYGGRPLDWARHFDQPAVADLLAAVTPDAAVAPEAEE